MHKTTSTQRLFQLEGTYDYCEAQVPEKFMLSRWPEFWGYINNVNPRDSSKTCISVPGLKPSRRSAAEISFSCIRSSRHHHLLVQRFLLKIQVFCLIIKSPPNQNKHFVYWESELKYGTICLLWSLTLVTLLINNLENNKWMCLLTTGTWASTKLQLNTQNLFEHFSRPAI